MSMLVSATDPRGMAAVQIVVDNKWKAFHDREGRPSWSIPSTARAGLYYRVTPDGCTCPDLQYRPWVACKHMLALRLYQELSEGEKEALYAF
jgi:hypothetical protein